MEKLCETLRGGLLCLPEKQRQAGVNLREIDYGRIKEILAVGKSRGKYFFSATHRHSPPYIKKHK